MPGDDDIGAVADRVNVDLGGGFQKAVDQHRLTLGGNESDGHVFFELRFVVANFHGASAEHKAGADQDRVADLLGDLPRLVHRAGDAVGRLAEVEPF